MVERHSHSRGLDVARMYNPMQQFGETFLSNLERVTDFQLELMQSYTRFAMQQWQNALEIRDPQTLQEYFGKQRQAAEEFGRRVTEEVRSLTEANRQLTDQAARSARQETEAFSDLTSRGVRQMRSATETAANAAENRAREMEERQTREDGGLPIQRYDDLNVDEIEQKLDKLGKDEVRKLLDYERSHKNRKTLNEAFERRL